MTDRTDLKKFEGLLEDYGDCCEGDGRYGCDTSPETNKAWKAVFDAYTTLATENERLRIALRTIAIYGTQKDVPVLTTTMVALARAALGEDK